MQEELWRAAEAIAGADALLITAGAGMGVDSGLPDFRGPEGFWKAYPPLAALNLRFEEIACPEWFHRDAGLAWGFYGHRLELYRRTLPHSGFAILRRWAEAKPDGYFVYTSNVDGQFQKAGFSPDRVVEAHGSLHRLQCLVTCSRESWSADQTQVIVDPETLLAEKPLPLCPNCRYLARPNLLMFGDWHWLGGAYEQQEAGMEQWIRGVLGEGRRLTLVECGAGRAIPTIRWFSERVWGMGATLVRINPRDPYVPPGGVSLAIGALAALNALEARIAELASP